MQTVERYGRPMVEALSYATLQEAREKELAYIAGQLRLIRPREGADTDRLVDLRAWLENRRKYFTGNPGAAK